MKIHRMPRVYVSQSGLWLVGPFRILCESHQSDPVREPPVREPPERETRSESESGSGARGRGKRPIRWQHQLLNHPTLLTVRPFPSRHSNARTRQCDNATTRQLVRCSAQLRSAPMHRFDERTRQRFDASLRSDAPLQHENATSSARERDHSTRCSTPLR